MKYDYQYDVALSYASEQYEYVKDVAFALQKFGLKVFFDKFDHEQIHLWGENLIDKFYDIFSKRAKYCVMFLSKNYSEKEWTLHEFDSIQVRNLKKHDHIYILPVRFDDTEMKSFNPAISYLNAKNYTPQQLAEIIYCKVNQLTKVQQNNEDKIYTTLQELYQELCFTIDEKLKLKIFNNIYINKTETISGISYTFIKNQKEVFYIQVVLEDEKTPPHISIYDNTFTPECKRDIQTAEIILDRNKPVFLNYGLLYSDDSSLNETIKSISEKMIEKICNHIS